MPDDAPTPDLNALRAASERFAEGNDELPAADRGAVERALPSVLGTVLGGLVLVALGGLTGVVSLGFAAVIVGLLAAGGAGYGLMTLGERETRREREAASARRSARESERAARGVLAATVSDALAHVERLDAEREQFAAERERLGAQLELLSGERERFAAERSSLGDERTRLHGKIDQLERRLAVKERKLARVQAFDAERRTLEPAPSEEPMAGQLTFDAVSD